jgi:hypothetical protein
MYKKEHNCYVGAQRCTGIGPSAIMDYLLEVGVASHISGVFELDANAMVVRAIYAIRLIKEGAWDNIDDIVGNICQLEARLQYQNSCWAPCDHGASIPRFTIDKIIFLERGVGCLLMMWIIHCLVTR